MNYKISFAQMAKLNTEQLSKQSSVTLKEAKAQARWLKTISKAKGKKQRSSAAG